jgi:hypothetical protein
MLAGLAIAFAYAAGLWVFLNSDYGGTGAAYADLYVNYAGGFVRRGLLGALAQLLDQQFGVNPRYVFATALGLAHFAVLFSCLLLIRRLGHPTHLALLVVLSPATLLYPAYEADTFIRKDVFAVALIAWHATMHRSNRRRDLVLALALTASVLVHELQAFFLPLHAWLIANRGNPRRMWVLLPAVTASILSAVAIGDPTVRKAICDSWNQAVCPGYIDSTLQDNLTAGIGVLKTIDAMFVVSLALSLVPLMVLHRLPLAPVQYGGRWLLPAGVAALPLFLLASDWGRWTHIFVMHIVFCQLAMANRRVARPAVHAPTFTPIERTALAYFYALGWQLANGPPWLTVGAVYEMVETQRLSLSAAPLYIVATLPAGVLVVALLERWRPRGQ